MEVMDDVHPVSPVHGAEVNYYECDGGDGACTSCQSGTFLGKGWFKETESEDGWRSVCGNQMLFHGSWRSLGPPSRP